MDNTFTQSRRRDLTLAIFLAALAAVVPFFVKDVNIQNIMVLTLMWAALSQSWNILSGYCGQISLGHALYFGLGAYTTTLLLTKFGVLPWFGMIAGGAISALIAYVTVALGGIGSVFGAFAGGIIVGLVEASTALILPPSLKSVGIYAVYLLVVFIRPRGQFGSI